MLGTRILRLPSLLQTQRVWTAAGSQSGLRDPRPAYTFKQPSAVTAMRGARAWIAGMGREHTIPQKTRAVWRSATTSVELIALSVECGAARDTPRRG